MGFLGAVHSELVKTKHTPFRIIHLCVPVMGALLFVVYYFLYGSTADGKKLKMILELTATVFPLLISVIVGLNITLEEKASHFQPLLAVPNRRKMILAKLAYLCGAGITSLSCLFLLFVFGIQFLGIADTVQPGTLTRAAAGIAFCNLIIYVLHLFLSLKFGLGTLFFFRYEKQSEIIFRKTMGRRAIAKGTNRGACS